MLLIVSQVSFSAISTSTDTISATPIDTYIYSYSASLGSFGPYSNPNDFCAHYASAFNGTYTSYTYTYSFVSYTDDNNKCNFNMIQKSNSSVVGTATRSPTKTLITTYVCPAGYTLTGTNCTISTNVDSCAAYAGQTTYLWVSKTNVPASVCDGTCTATVGSYSNFPDASPTSYQGVYYTYTGSTGSCTDENTGWVDAATALAANADSAAKELADKIAKEIADAETACGGVGFYTTGSFNGSTVVTCTNQDKKTNSTTTTTTSGATSTTTDTSTTTSNNGQTTTVNSDGTSTTTGGATTSSRKTSTTTTTTNPDGSTTTTTTEEGDTGVCDSSDMSGTVGCAELGDPSSADGDALGSESVQFGFGSGASWGATDASCPSNIALHGTVMGFSVPCAFFRMMRPFFLAICSLIAVYITFGIRRGGEG